MNEMEIRRTPEVVGAEIRSLTTQAKCITLWYGIEIGRRLCEAKELVEHGEWLNFLERETEFSQPSASRFMRLYNEYGAEQGSLFGAESKYSTLNNLSISNALRLLELPENEREEFAQEHDAEHISSRELERLIKEKKEAERQLQDAEERAAEDAGPYKEEVERLKKQLALSNAEVAVFNIHFAAVQESFNKLLSSLDKVKQTDAETAGKLEKALRAVLGQFEGRLN